MTTREHFTIALAAKMSPEEGWNLAHPDTEKELKRIARCAAMQADVLIAELARTCKESLQVQPDADGWIKHDPSGPIPRNYSGVKIVNGTEDYRDITFPKEYWNHEHSLKSHHITHYKP